MIYNKQLGSRMLPRSMQEHELHAAKRHQMKIRKYTAINVATMNCATVSC